ncbi:hypothetical protein ACH5RR_035247 [Cinchona calisaya]|uniref:J domain-containing protein n=1 Tax=Cinchona calisaya TaxID=153742 RepID=A0ABD2YFC8_9GENT
MASAFSAVAPSCIRFRPQPPPSRRTSAAYSTAERTCTSTTTAQIDDSQTSFYQMLGIPMGATCQEIKAAYRKLAKVLHPDVASPLSPADEFMRVHKAYTTLSDPEKRAHYDRTLFRRNLRRPSCVLSASPSYSGYNSRRTWETDQCW